MPSLTIKGLPDEIYTSLKASAERNRRSLNSEVIVSLRRSFVASRPPTEEVIDSLRRWHRKVASLPKLTTRDVGRARSQGRP